jgi:hypothetical protein
MRKCLVYSVIVGLAVLAWSCKKDEAINPYDAIVIVENDNPQVDNLPMGNFAWLHNKIFKPTCANSGCHDGTFEPHFNTIASAYVSIVNHPVISNDAAFSFVYRVAPGSANGSLLVERLTNEIPNSSGMMPLQTEPGSDWPANAANYIAQIESWINNGAKDMYGNAAPGAGGDFPPQVNGFLAFPEGNTTDAYPREDGIGTTPILVDAAEVDLWMLIEDDNTLPQNMTSTSVKIATSTDSFAAADEYPTSVQPGLTALDFSNSPATFIHRTTIDLSAASSGDYFFVRTYWDDGVQPSITEIPNDGSNAAISAIFILKVN